MSSSRDADPETDGTMVNILRELYARGVAIDSDGGWKLNTSSLHDAYSEFHVRLRQPVLSGGRPDDASD